MKGRKYLRGLMLGCFFLMWYLAGISCMVCKAESSLAENPYVTFSPDGKAFTTNGDETDTEWYGKEYTVSTGVKSTLRKLNTGEHYYDVRKNQKVSVGKWVVTHPMGRCIHDGENSLTHYHGLDCRKDICHQHYYSGWISYCADCGEKVVNNFFYMSREAARTLSELDMSLSYYYRCPHCTHLEMGTELKHHICKDISANQYKIEYDANLGKGYMPKSVHMYNNIAVYEGREVTPQTRLTMNSYTRLGYEFEGWNTKPDGSGIWFEDGAEILNLSTEEKDVVILYAQWKSNRSVLKIDPKGGSYHGTDAVYEVAGDYGASYDLSKHIVIPPKGVKIHFETNGGETVEDISGEMKFKYWSFKTPLHGELQNSDYIFKGDDGAVDYAAAIYIHEAIILPECRKEGYSFGGWYYDEELTKMAGTPESELKPSEDITLYACWVDLQLTSADNYVSNAGKGAVDLKWNQVDSREKTYMLYQKKEGGAWSRIYTEADVSVEKHVEKEFFFDEEEKEYVIPFTGYYKVTLYGAQGEGYETHAGGKGGRTTAEIYLKKGDVLKFSVGGQNGYNGGGNGLAFGNGGGYTGVCTENDEVLMIAGGGGGATALTDGMPGGLSLNEVSQMQGQQGMAGGGGGSQGGMAGTAVLHIHESECKHEHIGSADEYGGCYTVKEVCGNQTFTKSQYKSTFYYGNKNAQGETIYCVRCGSYSCPGHLDRYYKYQCTVCKKEYYDTKPKKCSSTKYTLGCDKEAGYVCGYDEGDILEATAAYGGSSYINTSKCLTYDEEPGANEGNGMATVEAVLVGFVEEGCLNGVEALDEEAPEAIAVSDMKVKAIDENKVNVVFARPQDRGTVYFHKAESYDLRKKEKISTSNQTMNQLVSGVVGYYYKVNERETAVITTEDEYLADTGESPFVGIVLTDDLQYLHIAAVDKAGNLSDTTHFALSKQDVIFWPVITEQVQIEEGDSVYQNGEYYYVRADGNTPFEVSFVSRLCGTAEKEYQINYLSFETLHITENPADDQMGKIQLGIPMEDVIVPGTNRYGGESMSRQYTGMFFLSDGSFSQVLRSNYCKDAKVVQRFIASQETDGYVLQLIPGAGVDTGKVKVSSDRGMDMENSIYLIADGQGPVIDGFDIPDDFLSQKEEEWTYVLEISARDMGSGLQRFLLEIRNTDNGGYAEIEDDDRDGKIVLKVNSQNSLFEGDFTIMAKAIDNVGNETVESYGLDAVTLYAYVEKLTMPQDEPYKSGEVGTLQIEAIGYVERIDVIFPQKWTNLQPNLNCRYEYQFPDYVKTEQLEFIVPLQVPDGTYTIEVKGYKGEKVLFAKPELLTITIEGSILDEIRTRLR